MLSIGIRQQLATATACPHQILHGHPDIGRLISSDLELSTYYDILRFFLALYEHAEAQRVSLAVWSEFSLESSIVALRNDIGSSDCHDGSDMAWIECPASCIGMLYVLHGASIGGKFIAKNVSSVLPEASLEFFGRGLKPGLWSALVDALETYQGRKDEFERILDSAIRTLQRFDRPIGSVSR